MDFLDQGVIGRLSRLQVAVRTPMLGSVAGLHRSATRGASVEFAEYRKYAPGDDIKHLDWRVFARTDRFYIREFEADTNLRCFLVVDTSASMKFSTAPTGTRFDYARRLAATIAHLLVHQGDAVGLTSLGEKGTDLPPRHTPTHLRQLYKILQEAKPSGESNLVHLLHEFAERIRQRALVVIISDLFTEVGPLLDAFKHLRFYKHDLAVFHLLDRQEIDFDFTRPVRFVDMESGADLITDPTVVRDAYRDAVNEYLTALRHGCQTFQVDYHLTYLDQSFEGALTQFLLQRIRHSKKGGTLMTFLQNWPLAVLLAALLPIIIHMLNRLRYRTVQWAAMIFLLKANKAATRRAKLRQYLLLACRALAILFMVWAMMRPVVGGWLGATAGGAPEVVVMLLDRSASMESKGGTEDGATRRGRAIELLTQAAKNNAGSRFVLIENVLRQPLEIGDAPALATMQMAGPTETAADIPAMFRAALEYLVKNKPGSAEIWLASDLQTTNWRPESQEWTDIAARFAGLPQETRVRILDLSGKTSANLSVALRSADFRPSKSNPEQGTLALTTEYKSASGTGTFPLRITRDGAASQVDLVLNAPIQRQSYKFDIQKLSEGGGWGKLELPADDSPADNAAYFVYRLPIPLLTTVITENAAARALAAAAAPDRTRADRLVEVLTPAEAGKIKWKDVALIIWNGPAPSEEVSAKLRGFVESGGVLLALPPGGASATGPLGITWGAAEDSKEPLRITTWDELDGPLAKTDNGASLPVARLEITRRQIPRLGVDTAHMHGLFADGQPFLVEQSIGAGRVFAVATSPEKEWSTLGEGFVFLPMVQRMVAIGGTRLAPPALAMAGEWQPADGEFWAPVDVEERRDARWRAGIYKHGGRLVALNRPDAEDGADEVQADALPGLLKGVKLTVMTGALDLKADRLQSEIWPAMIVATMIFMCLEMLLATSKGLAPTKLKPKTAAAPMSPSREPQEVGGGRR